MNSSIKLGRILGIPVGVNWSIVAVALLFAVSLAVQALPRSAPDAGLELRLTAAGVAVLVFFASILAHELGHAVAALGHGVGVDGITLWLLGGVAKLDRQSPTARAEFQIAVAGPAVSLVLGFFFISLAIIAAAVAPFPLVVAVLGWLGGVNVILAVFNMMPAAPLDGGRVLSAYLWHRSGDPEGSRITAGRAGLVLGGLLVLTGAIQLFVFEQFGGWLTALVGAFSFTAARAEIATATIRRRLAATYIDRFTVRHPTVVPDTVTVQQLVDRAGPAGQDTAHAVVRWGSEPIGYAIPAQAMAGLSVAERSWTTVGQVMWPPGLIERVPNDQTVDHLLRRWEAGALPMAVVTGAGGAAIGTITDENVRPLLITPDLWGRDRPEDHTDRRAGEPVADPPAPARGPGIG